MCNKCNHLLCTLTLTFPRSLSLLASLSFVACVCVDVTGVIPTDEDQAVGLERWELEQKAKVQMSLAAMCAQRSEGLECVLKFT